MTRSGVTWPRPKPRTPGVSISQPESSGSGSAIADDEVCRPFPVTALTTPDRPARVRHQRVDERRLPDPGLADEHADPAVERLAQPAQRLRGQRLPGGQHRDVKRPVERPDLARGGQVGLGQHQQRLEARVVGGDQAPVDEPGLGVRVGQRATRSPSGRRWPPRPAPAGRCRRGSGAARWSAPRTRTIRASDPALPEVSPASATRSPTTTEPLPSSRAFIAVSSRPAPEVGDSSSADSSMTHPYRPRSTLTTNASGADLCSGRRRVRGFEPRPARTRTSSSSRSAERFLRAVAPRQAPRSARPSGR